ncbi:hypothetical protein P6O24_00525 [Clostridium perfringens]|uniref:hypothetical protein n=1 Tax=Clostridium perfringens TaxID=1502 RepID=UPI001ABAD646|nr:hypothetical protein [Clostridium perfringens]MBO3376876.1 hypothetical protein [Clostridium perfringens]MDK0557581.1 hypothetical protein [Clostridium perfringens]MDM0689824.1 hypothetical protein [Clostridium perfringens]
MYKCYRLKFDENLKELISGYEEIGKRIMEEKRANIRSSLESYLREDNSIDFTKLQDDWFPTVDSDIFISHSHADIKVVNALAGWFFKKFNVNVFVDSYIWGYCNELLREIDEKHCKHENGSSFDYDKRNFSTAQVHMILSNALNKMIDKTECVIFLETDNSLSVNTDIEKGTSSAWIYSELITTSIIRRMIPKRLESDLEERKKFIYDLQESFKPYYRISLSHCIDLKAVDLKSISELKLYRDKEYLDKMYKLVKEKVKIINE